MLFHDFWLDWIINWPNKDEEEKKRRIAPIGESDEKMCVAWYPLKVSSDFLKTAIADFYLLIGQVEYKLRLKIEKNNNKHKMSEELPILKGILKGNVTYHNARKYNLTNFHQAKAVYVSVTFVSCVTF